MKWEQPIAEAHIDAMACRLGKPRSFSIDSGIRKAGALCTTLFQLLLLAAGANLYLWFLHVSFEGALLQMAGAGGLLTLLAEKTRLDLWHTSTRSENARILRHLPVRGVDILSWARGRTLSGCWKPLFLSAAVGWGLQGFPQHATQWTAVVPFCLLLCCMVYATAAIPSFAPKADRLWQRFLTLGSGSIFILTLVVALWREETFGVPLPPALFHTLERLSWILPPTWVMTPRVEGVGLILSIVWIGWGALLWWGYPRTWGGFLDLPHDLRSECDSSPGAGAIRESLRGEALGPPLADPRGMDRPRLQEGLSKNNREAHHEHAACEPGCIGNVSAEVPAAPSGWIERLAWRFLNPEDRPIASMVLGTWPKWSVRATFAIIASAVMLVSMALTKVFPMAWWAPEDVLILLGPWVGLTVLALVFPWGNMIPRATRRHRTGSCVMHTYALLPCNARTLLRVSNRITWARALAFLVLAIPTQTIQLVLLGAPPEALPTLLVIPYLSLLWCLSRPVFVVNVFLQNLRSISGAWISRFLTRSLFGLLVVMWLMVGLAAVSAPSFSLYASPWMFAALLLGPLLVAGSANLLFELLVLRIRLGQVDLVLPVR